MSHKLVALRPPRHNHQRRDGRYEQLDYSQAAPFFINPNGVLVHRVRALYRLSVVGSEREPWYIVDYWCGNVGRSDDVDEDLAFDPGKLLVCARCETLAVSRGEATSSKLAGRHVCVGVCRPMNLCLLHGESSRS